jgi:hypothetical protein
MELDENIVPLVMALGALPGVFTKSSCGGHEKPQREEAQRPQGEWYISFVASGWGGAYSLATLALALTRGMADGVSLKVEWDGKIAPICCLEGRGGKTTPEQAAALIGDLVDEMVERK